MTPKRAIRAKCKDCSMDYKKVRECEFDGKRQELCALYFQRSGKRTKEGKTPVKSIRDYCSWCTCGAFIEIDNCDMAQCPLHIFRFGCKPGSKRFNSKSSIKK
mgnify:CR=1 FL=1